MDLSYKSSNDYNYFKLSALTIKVMCKDFSRIKFEECEKLNKKSDEDIKLFIEKFEKIRAISHNLGISTWSKLKWQIGLFFIGTLLFVIVQFFL